LLELTEANRSVQTHEMVTGGRPINAMSPETIGLTLAEGKSVLAGMQTQLVQAQADVYCQHRRECQHCGSHRDIKDWRTRRLTTLFGGSLAAYGNGAPVDPSGGCEIGAANPDGQAIVQPNIGTVDRGVARRRPCEVNPQLSGAIV